MAHGDPLPAFVAGAWMDETMMFFGSCHPPSGNVVTLTTRSGPPFGPGAPAEEFVSPVRV